MKSWINGFAALVALGALVACDSSDEDHAPPPGNIVEVAQSNGLSSLAAAATKAGLVTTLTNPSATLTVFAPTNAAFDTLAVRLGFANGGAMVTALPASALASILSYHVLPARRSAAELVAGGTSQATVYSFEGAPTRLSLNTSSGVVITDAVLTTARVATADVPASNGVVHVIDKVLVPPGVLNIVQMAQANPIFSSLVKAVGDASLVTALTGAGPLTVFAPTNDAFAAISSTVTSLTVPQLTTVLTYHVLSSQVLSSGIPFGTPVNTLAGQRITINSTPLGITDTTTTAAPIIATDVRASNGVIHVISKVLLPTL
jgi:uncharacterized surface protein with fasciclin (FAS1) repeats